MPRPPQLPEITEYLRKVWEEAYKNPIIFDYRGEAYAELRIYTLKTLLYNYRKSIRLKKLQPEFIEEWTRLEQSTLKLLDKERFIVERKFIFRPTVSKKQAPLKLPFDPPSSMGTL